VPVVSKYAQLEFRFGSAERGRTLFEELLADNPKRADLWSVYLDMEQKAGTPESVRHLFDRVTTMPFNAHKMKFFMKRYLAFEKAHGTPESVEAVKARAVDFIERKLGDGS